MAADWLPIADCLAQLGTLDDPALEAEVDRARIAVASYVERMLPGLAVDGAFTPAPHVVYGATMLVARLHARKGSPAGIAAYEEFATTILRSDPDVDRLLGIGKYAAPVIG